MPVTLTSYNIQYGVGQDAHYDLGRTLTAISDVDIVCLQEVTTGWPVCGSDDQPAIITRELNRYSVYAPAYEVDCSTENADGRIYNARRGFGNMVLSRWPILYSRTHSLPRPPVKVASNFYPCVDLPRIALEAVISIEGQPLRILCVHLSHLPGEQQTSQVASLKQLVRGLPTQLPLWDADLKTRDWSAGCSPPPVCAASMVVGDFNCEPDSALYQGVTACTAMDDVELTDAWTISASSHGPDTTCVDSDGSLTRLDYLFVTSELTHVVQHACVDQTTKASDHFPVRFILDL